MWVRDHESTNPILVVFVAAELDFEAAEGGVWVCAFGDESAIERGAAFTGGEEGHGESAGCVVVVVIVVTVCMVVVIGIVV